MVKVRMNTADVAAEVKCLRRLIGMRCSNVYDLSPKTYVFKLMNSSGVTDSGESEKVLLLMESGVRLHTTAYVRDKSNTPSGFTLKLRKHIRTRRLEDVRQLGYDRIILFQFGLGVNAHYVILELYAQGNILLTDPDFTVLTLLRSHRDDDKGISIMSRHRYPTEISRVFERTTTKKLQDALAGLDKPEETDVVGVDGGEAEVSDKPKKEKQCKQKGGKSSELKKNSSEGSRAKQATLKTVLGEALGYGPQLSEHMILDTGLAPNTKVSASDKLDEDAIQVLVEAVKRFEDWLQDIISGEKIPEGYILMQKQNLGKDGVPSEPASHRKMYDEFCPILLNQFKTREHVKFDTFDAALDEFYSKIESQRSEQQQKAKEDSAVQKLTKIRTDQESRVLKLRKEVDQFVKMAELIEYNLEDVDAAILAVRVALAKGMSWEDLARMVKEERKSGNPVAALIDQLHLERNCMILLLSNNLDEMDDDEKTLPADKVEVDIALSAHANARRWYEMKKKQESKQEKTVKAHEKAFKAAERKTRMQLSQVCHSQAWDSKIVTSAWWVYPHQVSKTAPTGEYLTVGSFMIRGKKNFLPPHPLIMGFGLLFRLDESSLGSHLNERRVRGEEDGINDITESGPTEEISDSESDQEATSIKEGSELEPIASSKPGDLSELFSKDDNAHNDIVSASNPTGNGAASVTPQLEDLFDRALGIGATTSGRKYGIETLQVSVDEEIGQEEEKKETVKSKRYISKAERKKLKKAQKYGYSDLDSSEESEEEEEENTGKSVDQPTKKVPNSKPANVKLSRGQKSKLKKMKEKYADQDEEERRIRMALLASAGNPQKKSGETQEDTVAAKEKVAVSGPEEAPKVCYRCKKIGHLSRECPELSHEHRNANGEGRNKSLASSITNEAAADKVVMEEEDIHEIGEEEKEKLNDVDYLTGIPLPTDILLYAVPVCGPYTALQSYKYRVKIIPGSAKRGKAAKTAMNLFSHMPEASGREKELMKACGDPELVAAIIGNVKISAAGLSQLKQKQKKGKKKGN
ncbi:Ribosome quality control complex subunit NEMF [Linum perenne]